MSHIAFVAGATGFTGREVVRQLIDAGVQVTAHVRPDSSRLEHWKEHFSSLGAHVDTTTWTAPAMNATLAALSPTLVFGLLGTTKARAKKLARQGGDPESASYERVDYGLTKLLLDAAVEAGSQPRFVYLSSAGVTSGTRNAYLAVRARLEADLQASPLPWIAARPSFITGERDEKRTGEAVGSAVGDALLSVVGLFGAKRLRERYRSTDNTTLAAALVRLALDPDAQGIYESETLR